MPKISQLKAQSPATVAAIRYVAGIDASPMAWPVQIIAQPDVMATPPTLAVYGPGGSSPINAGSPTSIAYDDARITHLGQDNIVFNQFSRDYFANKTNGNDTSAPCADEFDFYGDDLALLFRAEQTNTAQFWAWVDGKPATAAPVIVSANTSAGSVSWYRITFGSVAMRRIRIYRYLADFGGIDIKPTGAIFQAPRLSPKLFVLGDSYILGIGATTELAGMTQSLGRLLGMEVFQAGQGGTGYVNNGGGGNKGPYTAAERIAKIKDVLPDYVLVFGSENDDGLSGVEAAAASVYSQIASASPASRVIVVGPPSLGSTITPNRAANRDAVKAAALAAPNVIGFIDPNNDEQGLTWISGTGNAGAPDGSGNADIFTSYGTTAGHPTQAGHDYYARRIAFGISALIA